MMEEASTSETSVNYTAQQPRGQQTSKLFYAVCGIPLHPHTTKHSTTPSKSTEGSIKVFHKQLCIKLYARKLYLP
jgi:hypothetical protein